MRLNKNHLNYLKSIKQDDMAYLVGKSPKQAQWESIKIYARIIKSDARQWEYFDKVGGKL